MRYAARRDSTHGPLLRRFQFQGCSAVTLPASEAGRPDALIGCSRRNHLVEFKNPESRYGKQGASQVQQDWAAAWRGERPFVVSTEDEVDDLVRVWRAEAARP